jgi:hypothetical protein
MDRRVIAMDLQEPIGFSSLKRNVKPTEFSPTCIVYEIATQRAHNSEIPTRALSSREFYKLSVDLSKESSNRVRKGCVC